MTTPSNSLPLSVDPAVEISFQYESHIICFKFHRIKCTFLFLKLVASGLINIITQSNVPAPRKRHAKGKYMTADEFNSCFDTTETFCSGMICDAVLVQNITLEHISNSTLKLVRCGVLNKPGLYVQTCMQIFSGHCHLLHSRISGYQSRKHIIGRFVLGKIWKVYFCVRYLSIVRVEPSPWSFGEP